MSRDKSSSESTFSPAAEKNFRAALRRFILKEFPRLGGERVVGMFIDELLRLVESHHLLRDRVGVGQMLWYAVDAADPAYPHKRMADAKMVPVLLTLVAPEDIAARRRGEEGRRERNRRTAARLLREAWEQGGVLSLADLALIMGLSAGYLSDLIGEWESEHQEVLPRRGTVHDLGRSVSHKALICRKAILEGKQTPEIAKETHHSEASVDRYLLDLERVAYAMRKHDMDKSEISFTTQMSEGLVSQYMDLARELGLAQQERCGKEVSSGSTLGTSTAAGTSKRPEACLEEERHMA